MLEIFDSVCILLAKAEQKHFQFTKKLLEETGLGITPGQMVVLYTLYKGDGISITDLSKRCFLDNSTLTGLLDRLERLELVTRVDVPGDRRSYNIHLTEKALPLHGQITGVMEQVAEKMLAGCSQEEADAFRRVLLKIYDNL
ncbi:MAG: MarR family transcriptional regulator [Negativicutes bacterium]|nr:MarR family transcriptional regulator [Negativicutes bacterium]